MNESIKLGVSGDPGSFSEEAGRLYAKSRQLDATLDYLIDMEGVLHALNNGSIDRGIFPVVNLYGGLVRMAFDAMGRYPFRVLDELWLSVHQCLLVKPHTKKDQILKVISHPQALAQCKKYLAMNFNACELVEFQDTAKAAKALSTGEISVTSAVIAPEKAAENYGLEVLEKDIQDVNPNLTGFIIVERLKNTPFSKGERELLQ